MESINIVQPKVGGREGTSAFLARIKEQNQVGKDNLPKLSPGRNVLLKGDPEKKANLQELIKDQKAKASEPQSSEGKPQDGEKDVPKLKLA